MQRVYVQTGEAQGTVVAPAGVSVVSLPLAGETYHWDARGVRRLEARLARDGLEVHSFHGCFEGSQWRFEPSSTLPVIEPDPVCPPVPTPIAMTPDRSSLTGPCQSLAADPTVCLTRWRGTVSWLSSEGIQCVTSQPLPAGLTDFANLAWGGEWAYGCGDWDKLFRLNLVTGQRDEAYVYCSGVGLRAGGLLVKPLGGGPLQFYPSFEHAQCGQGTATPVRVSKDLFDVQGNTVSSAWYSDDGVVQQDVVTGSRRRVDLGTYDGWLWGMSVDEKGTTWVIQETDVAGQSVLAGYDPRGEPVGEPLELFFNTGLVCTSN